MRRTSRQSRSAAFWAALLLLGGIGLLPASTMLISEVLTQNSSGLRDEDGATPGWVEIYNNTGATQDLLGWSLTPSPNRSPQWLLPSTNLASGGRLVVFVSGKDRGFAGRPLHASFRLPDQDGYVALISPQGLTASELAYGRQRKNVSFGIGRTTAEKIFVGPLSSARAWVPPDATSGTSWTGGSEPFDDATWTAVPLGIGFDLSSGGSDGLLGFWDFNSDTNSSIALDRSGNQHHGSLQGGALHTSDRGGRTGQPGDRAVQFGPPASAARISLPDAANGWFDTTKTRNAVTFSFWTFGSAAQPAQSSAFWGAAGTSGSGTRSAQAHVPWSDSIIYWDTGGTDSSLHRVSVAEPDSTRYRGRWNHYVFLKDKAKKEIWQNGRLMLAGTSTAPLAPIRSFYIGSGPEGLYSYAGLIDDFAIWSRGLSGPEIIALSQGASPLTIGRVGSLVRTDVGNLMHGINASIYLRAPFAVAPSEVPGWLSLQISYADGFLAYLNGTPVARRFAPAEPSFDSAATTESPQGRAFASESLDLSPFAASLRPGLNLLTLQGLNGSATDPEFLLDPVLRGGPSVDRQYFPEPTPGQANGLGESGLLPRVEFSHHRGFFNEPFLLRFWVAEPGAQLVYTTNGTIPSLSNGVMVNGTNAALTINATTTLRVLAQKPGYLSDAPMTHTFLFPGQVMNQRRPAFVGASWPSGPPTDFEIDARVVQGALPTRSFTNALLNLPTLSIVTPPEDLFGAQGIYANSSYPKNPATDLELPVSAELIYPDGSQGFQADAGLQIHGNITRDKTFTPKHSFNLVFRKEYGAGRLRYPLFADSDVDSFDRLVLRAGSTDTWATVNWEDSLVDGVQRWVRDEASFIRDQWVRDAQIALGQQSSHGNYVHLYLSGIYWGLYNLCEHTDDQFAADYYGGAPEDYDVLADFAEVHAGDKIAWDAMNNLASAGLASDASYQRIQGNNPDGSRNPLFPVYLDVTNLVDYMILHVAIGADDWPNHNWWAARKRGPDSTGFKFFAWDQEISINSLIRTRSSWGSVYAEADVPETPTFVYARCRANAEFRQLFADRVQLHLFNSGALTVASNLARWDARIAEIDAAVVAESARWGDYRRPARPYTREVEWLSSNAWMRTVFFPSNQAVVMKRFRDVNLYPKIGAPILSQFGGSVPPGFELAITHTNSSGTLFLTRDGSDPRLRGGAVSPRAQAYSAPLPVLQRETISVRTRFGTNWSALVRASFEPTQDLSRLQLTEIMYNPLPEGQIGSGEFEFLEFKNVGNVALDLSGLTFDLGISFRFPEGAHLDPGQFAVLAKNPTQLKQRYPGVSAYGPFEGRLADSGETLRLTTGTGLQVLAIAYSDAAPWPMTPDGWGFSLVPNEQAAGTIPNSSEASGWRASAKRHGSPGAEDPPPQRAEVFISEVMANGGEAGDWIELINRSAEPADVSGWLLTDDPATPAKYHIPPQTILPPGGIHIFRDSAFGAPSAGGIPFGFSAEGDEVYLFSADSAGQLTGASHGFRFEGSDPGESFVVYRNSVGEEFLTHSQHATPSQPNASPKVGPVVISEIHYHPGLEDLEFVELHNLSDQIVPLYDPANPTNRWRLRGLDFEFPAGASLPPQGRCLVLTSEKSLFLERYPVPDSICFGPASGNLQDSGELLELVRPQGGSNHVAMISVDRVRYNDHAPWPPAADGAGPSLHRVEEQAFGDDSNNWVAARPTPGEGLPGGLPPRWVEQPRSQSGVEGSSVSLGAIVAGEAPLLYQWQHNGMPIPRGTNATLEFPSLTADDSGGYRLGVYNGSGTLLSSNVTVSVLRLPFLFIQPGSRALSAGATTSLTAGAEGTGTLRYQWFLNGREILGANANVLRINALSAASEGTYQVRVTDDVGSVMSEGAQVEILRRVSLVSSPRSQSVLEGADVDLKAVAEGTLPIRYQWKRGATVILNTNAMSRTSVFRLANVALNQAGTYSVTLGNQAAGTVISPSFTLTVLADTDRDRTPNEWELRFGFDPNNPLDASMDTDQDGFSNREEYAAGTDPRSAASRLEWQDIGWDGQQVSLRFLAVSNRTYSVFHAESVNPEVWTRWDDIPSAVSTELRTITDSGAAGTRFYRLVTPAQP